MAEMRLRQAGNLRQLLQTNAAQAVFLDELGHPLQLPGGERPALALL